MCTAKGYKNFLGVQTSLYWLVNSSIEVVLNRPNKMHDVFVADITCCYESIPLHEPDNLIDAVASIVKIGFKQAQSHHPKATTSLWVRVKAGGTAANAVWATNCPSYGNCFSLSAERLIELHGWLMNSCYVNLGDRV